MGQAREAGPEGTLWLGDLTVPRRVVLLGAGGGLLTACSDDEPPSTQPRRRRKRKRKRKQQESGKGPVELTQADLDSISQRLTELLDGEDRQAFIDYARPSALAQWEQMWDGLHTVPTLDRRFLLQSADVRWVNTEGGPVNATVRGVVAYRIDGCDAQPMAHLCDLNVFKSTTGKARVQTLGPVRDDTAAPWLLSEVIAEVSSSVVLIARAQDASSARGVLSDIDAGARRAMDYLTPPAGVSRICVTLGWPEARERLYGGSNGDFVGSAHNYRYVDPQALADTGQRGKGEVFPGSRVVVDPDAVSAQGAEKVSAHEAIHALAYQWGQSAAPLYAEGLARYVELGPAETERAARQLGARGYRAFADRVTARPGRAGFYDPTWLQDNYAGAAATCAFVARDRGDTALQDMVRAAYEGQADPAGAALGVSQSELLTRVARSLER